MIKVFFYFNFKNKNFINQITNNYIVTNGKIKRIKGYDTSYTLLNTNHIMVSHNNKWFTDYDEIEWINNEENEQYVIDKLNEQAKDIKGVA